MRTKRAEDHAAFIYIYVSRLVFLGKVKGIMFWPS